jgi:hypothetical protein
MEFTDLTSSKISLEIQRLSRLFPKIQIFTCPTFQHVEIACQGRLSREFAGA